MAKTNMPAPGAVVGTIHSPGSLSAARALCAGAVDFLELRVDAFAGLPNSAREIERLATVAASLPAPLIVTVRHLQEGGACWLSAAQRGKLLRQFLGCAKIIDVELRSASGGMVEILAAARAQGVSVIISHHDFRTTPTLARLDQLAQRARGLGCDIFKVATLAHTARDLSVLLAFLTGAHRSRRSLGGTPALSVMGMGEFGKISRLVLGRAGSVLNYGYLDALQVPGQWPAELLKERLLELIPQKP